MTEVQDEEATKATVSELFEEAMDQGQEVGASLIKEVAEALDGVPLIAAAAAMHFALYMYLEARMEFYEIKEGNPDKESLAALAWCLDHMNGSTKTCIIEKRMPEGYTIEKVLAEIEARGETLQ